MAFIDICSFDACRMKLWKMEKCTILCSENCKRNAMFGNLNWIWFQHWHNQWRREWKKESHWMSNKKGSKSMTFFRCEHVLLGLKLEATACTFFIDPMEKRTNKRMEKKFSKQILRLCGWSNEPYSQMRLKNTKKTLHSLSYSMSESWQKPRERSIMEIHVLHAFRIVPVYVHLIMVWKQSKKSVLLIFHRKLFHCIQQFFLCFCTSLSPM